MDRQLVGRAARQGDPGSAQAFVSLDDELLGHAAPWLRERARRVLDGGLPGAPAIAAQVVRHAQSRASGKAAAQRQQLLEFDLSLDESLAFAGPEI